MENGPVIDGLPIKNGDPPWLCYTTRWSLFLVITIYFRDDDWIRGNPGIFNARGNPKHFYCLPVNEHRYGDIPPYLRIIFLGKQCFFSHLCQFTPGQVANLKEMSTTWVVFPWYICCPMWAIRLSCPVWGVPTKQSWNTSENASHMYYIMKERFHEIHETTTIYFISPDFCISV